MREYVDQLFGKHKHPSGIGPNKIIGSYWGWSLCPDSEPLLRTSLDNRAVMLVDRTFLVKFDGRLAGLALHDVVFPSGKSVKAGNWYCPVDKKTRRLIEENFDKGITSMETADSTWVYMRQFVPADFHDSNTTTEQWLERLTRYVDNLIILPETDTIPYFGPKNTYRRARFEGQALFI